MSLATIRKAIIQVLTLATAITTYGVLSPDYAAKVSIAVAVIGSIIHYQVPNDPAPMAPLSKGT